MAKRPHLPAIVGYAGLTLGVLWPAVVGFASRPMVDPADGSVFRWIWWYMPRAVARGDNPFVSDEIFHPVGADLAVTTSAPLISAVTWPVQAMLGQAAQVNLVQLGATFTAAIGAYLLAHHVCGDRRAAFFAGVVWALLPHRMVHLTLGHLNLVHLGTLPLLVLAFLRVLELPSRTRAAVLGAGIGGTFLIDPQLVILFGFAAVPLAVVRRALVVQAWRRLAGAAVLALVVSLPLLVPIAAAVADGESGEPLPTSASLVYSASPLSWVVPPLDQLWIGHLGATERLTPTLEGIAYPGLAVILLAGWSLVRGRRHAAQHGWLAMAIVGVVLSLGPYPFVRGTAVKAPLPFFLVRSIPGLDAFRVPGRFAVVGALGLTVLAAMALAELARRHPRRARAIVAVVCAVTLVELLPRSLPESPEGAPSPYHAIAAHRAGGAVLEIPIQWSTGQTAIGFSGGRGKDFLFLVNATVHERPTVSGAASRYSEDRLEQLLDVELYRQVLALQGEERFEDEATFGRDELAAAGISFVVYDRREPAPRALAYFEALDLPVVADDGAVVVWSIDG